MGELADVAVIGGGIAGRVAAIECAKVTLKVVLWSEPEGQLPLHSISLGHVTGIDGAAETFQTGDRIDELCQELGVTTEVLRERNTLLRTAKVTAPIPRNVTAGVPGNPLGNELAAFVPGAKLRAYADRVMPLLKLGEERNLAKLVRQRLGAAVLNGFTDPFCRAIFGVPADRVDVGRAAPKLNRTFTSLGTLSGAALALSDGPDEARRVVGGMSVLRNALERRSAEYAVIEREERVESIRFLDSGVWQIRSGTEVLHARTVIAAVDPETLGEQRLAGVTGTEREVSIVTALIRGAAGANATGLVFAAHPMLASVSRPAARSEHLAEQLSDGEDLLRIVVHDLDAQPEDAIQEAATALGFDGYVLEDFNRENWTVIRPWVCAEDPPTGQPRSDESGTLEWTGQWAAGSGLARVVLHAHEAAHRIRSRALQLKLAADS
ncbi:MAG: protoporphyrinogen/coproporphyrinogen oxidase [Agromyces sp.]